MEKVLYYIKSPFLLAAVMCAIVFYTGLVPVKDKNQYKISSDIENVSWISGKICANPSKSGTGKTYSSKISLEKVKISSGNMDAQTVASGELSIVLPSSLVESLYPGKLYSLSKDSVLIEKGERISCSGKWSEKTKSFFVDKIKYEGYGQDFFGKIAHFRAICRLIFKRLMFSWGNAGGLVLSLLSGSREYLEDGLGDAFRNAGLSHILALSGMHLSFFSSLVGGIGKKIGKKIMPFFQLFGILFFVWFAGLSPSLFRALLCSLLSLIAKFLLCGKTDTLEIMSCAFLIHCVVFPMDMFSVAFMLSYGALGGILLFADYLMRFYSPVFPPFMASSLSASTGAQIATTPITISVFGTFTPIGIVSTVFASPLVSVFITLALIFMIVSLFFPFLSGAFGSIMDWLYGVLVYIVKFFAQVPPLKFT